VVPRFRLTNKGCARVGHLLTDRENQPRSSKESEEQLDEEAEERFDDESLAPNSSSQDLDEDGDEREATDDA